jgi:hypothetical protein
LRIAWLILSKDWLIFFASSGLGLGSGFMAMIRLQPGQVTDSSLAIWLSITFIAASQSGQ